MTYAIVLPGEQHSETERQRTSFAAQNRGVGRLWQYWNLFDWREFLRVRLAGRGGDGQSWSNVRGYGCARDAVHKTLRDGQHRLGMRYLLSILVMLSVLAGQLCAATVSSSKLVDLSPETPVTAALYLTNFVRTSLINDMTVRLLPGTFNILANRGVTDNYADTAPLQFIAKTNVTVEGAGPNTVIFSPTLGNFVNIQHCYNLKFRRITFQGTVAAYAATTNGLFGCINVSFGTNNFIEFEDCAFRGHADHGYFNSNPRNSKSITFRNCVFEDIGTTNNPVGGSVPDGSGAQVSGDNFFVLGCTFRRCRIGVEIEGSSVSTIRNIVIEGNLFDDPKMESIRMYGSVDSGIPEDVFIRRNIFRYNAGGFYGGFARAINFNQGRRIYIENNSFQGANSAMVLLTDPLVTQLMEDVYFRNNGINNLSGDVGGQHGHAIYVAGQSGYSPKNIVVEGNGFTNCTWAGTYFQGVSKGKIHNNDYWRVGNGSPFGNPITLYDGTSACQSNTITFNRIFSTIAGPAIDIISGSLNRLYDNEILGWGTTPWLDSGTANVWGPNWVGTNWVPRMPQTNSMVTTFAGGTLGGTNFIWNVGAAPVQVLDVTNTCLIIITNNSSFNLAQRSKLIIVNNKTTNVGVYFTTAGVRNFGTDRALMASLAATHTSLTNGYSAVLEDEYAGTNHVLTVTHQR